MSKPSDVIELFHKAEPLFVALGDPNRQQIVVQLLQTHKLSVNAITDATPLSRPAVSHHLKILAQAGLVSVERMERSASITCRMNQLRRLIYLKSSPRLCVNVQIGKTKIICRRIK